MPVEFDFGGQVTLVTGASGALGSAVCEGFSDAGATVCGADVVAPGESERLDAGGVEFYGGDLTDEADAERVVSAVVDDHGRLDHLVNVAGTWRGGTPIDETPVEEFELLFDDYTDRLAAADGSERGTSTASQGTA